uniref:Uncharacterized protein n=1 Tax=Arundo donax TaxID=35708 RepID=A0A0A9T7W4_ARUDO
MEQFLNVTMFNSCCYTFIVVIQFFVNSSRQAELMHGFDSARCNKNMDMPMFSQDTLCIWYAAPSPLL